MIELESTVGEIAVQFPLATRVFERRSIDFCCGGGVALEKACQIKGLDPEEVLKELRAEVETPTGEQTRWDEKPLNDLVEHILDKYHAPLRPELDRLAGMAMKVADVHSDKRDFELGAIQKHVRALQSELEQHMAKEEQILFPMIKSGNVHQAEDPILVMGKEHEEAGAALAELRRLTNDYTVPEEACTTWRALWVGLEQLEKDLHEHIHLENNVLFPRALHSAS